MREMFLHFKAALKTLDSLFGISVTWYFTFKQSDQLKSWQLCNICEGPRLYKTVVLHFVTY